MISRRDRPGSSEHPVQDMGDGGVVEVSEEAHDMLASYVVGCNRLEAVEAGAAEVEPAMVDEAERRLAMARRQLSATLLRLGSIRAHTPGGALVKIAMAQGYLDEFPIEDPGLAALLRSIFADAERLYPCGCRRDTLPTP